MKAPEIVDALVARLAMPGGRHLYGVLGSYERLDRFASVLTDARAPEGRPFPKPLNINRGILDGIPDDAFRKLVQDEARRPEPARAHVAKAFESFLRTALKREGLLVLAHLELLFAYDLELNVLRTLAADENRVILLLPGTRQNGKAVMFPGLSEGSYALPINLIADNHLWELSE